MMEYTTKITMGNVKYTTGQIPVTTIYEFVNQKDMFDFHDALKIPSIMYIDVLKIKVEEWKEFDRKDFERDEEE